LVTQWLAVAVDTARAILHLSILEKLSLHALYSRSAK
jgi:hypothetical protein